MKSTLKLASHKNYAVFSFDLFADFVISLNDNLHILDFDVDADLVEWEPSIFKFIPNSSITVTHHLERERELRLRLTVAVQSSAVVGLCQYF